MKKFVPENAIVLVDLVIELTAGKEEEVWYAHKEGFEQVYEVDPTFTLKVVADIEAELVVHCTTP